jgi:hypothetical protein
LNPLGPYLDPEARDRRLLELAALRGGEVVEYGRSFQGRPLLAARLPAASGAGTRRVLASAGIHGPEYVAAAVALGVLERADQPAGRRLREGAELWVIPCINPDGYARVWEARGAGTMAELRPNARGVDLNRNFPLPAGRRRRALPGAGSSRPGAATYVGQGPLSEPETAALDRLLAERGFAASSNGHCFMGRLIPAHVEDAGSYRAYRQLCDAFRRAQRHRRYGRLASRFLDTFTGEMEDFQHHHHSVWAVCLETFPLLASFRQHLRAPSLFWRMNPRDPSLWVDNDVPGIFAFLQAALELPPPGASGTAALVAPG